MNAYQAVTISLFVLLAGYLGLCVAEKDFGYCGDPHCTVLLGVGEASQNYAPSTPQGISLKAGDKVEIYVRNCGPKRDMIGIKSNGRKGYIRKSVIVEKRTLISQPTYPATVKFLDNLSRTRKSHPSSSSSHLHANQNSQPIISPDDSKSIKDPSSSPASERINSGTNQEASSENVDFASTPNPPAPSPTESHLGADSQVDSTTMEAAVNGALKSLTDFHTSNSVPEHTQVPSFTSEVTSQHYNSIMTPSSIQSSIPDAAFVTHPPGSSSAQNSDLDHQEQISQEDTLQLARDTREQVLSSMTEAYVKKAVDAITSQYKKEVEETTDDETGDEELQKTLLLLSELGMNTTEILNDQNSVFHPQDILSKDISRDHSITPSIKLPQDSQVVESNTHSNSIASPPTPSPVVPSSSTFNSQQTVDPVYSETSSAPDQQNDAANEPNAEQDATVGEIEPEISRSGESSSDVEHNENSSQIEKPSENSSDIEKLSENSGDIEKPSENSGKMENQSKNSSDIENQSDNNGDMGKPSETSGGIDKHIDNDGKVSNNIHDIAENISVAENMSSEADSSDIFNDIESDQEEKSEATSSDPLNHDDRDTFTTKSHFMSDSMLNDEDVNINQVSSSESSYNPSSSEEEESSNWAFGKDTNSFVADKAALMEESHISAQRQILQNNQPDFEDPNLSSVEPEDTNEDNTPYPSDVPSETVESETPEESDVSRTSFISDAFSNAVASLRAFLDNIVVWLPESIQLYLDVSKISARAVVFTSIIAFPCALLFIATVFIKERSKEQKLIARLREAEHQLYLSSTERDILRDETRTLKEQLISSDDNLADIKNFSANIEKQLQDLEVLNNDVSCKQLESVDVIHELEERILSYSAELKNLKLALHDLQKENSSLSEKQVEQQETFSATAEEVERLKSDMHELEEQKKADENLYSEKEKQFQENIMHLHESCNQLLQEADQWNSRVKELTEQLSSETALKEDLQRVSEAKDLELESLRKSFANLEVLQNLKELGDDEGLEEKMKTFMDISSLQNEVEKLENVSKCLSERLQQEKKKVLDLEVQFLESKSDLDKMKIDYDQAVQLRTEAQSKLNFLTEHFEAKELQLQKKLGFLEVVKQQNEEHSSHAERRVHLIEKENESYKYQLETMKQEMEDTERNLKNQIAAQEKKAHENWLAARAAERKTEEMKQDSAQLRQRLTLLEREQENWVNSSQNDIVKPVAQSKGWDPYERMSDMHDLSGSQEGSISSEFLPSTRHLPPEDLLPLRPTSHPLLPPGPMMPPPPPPPPHFLPPPHFNSMMNLPPPRQPWRMYPDSDRRITPSDFEPRRGYHHHHHHHHQPPHYYDDRDRDRRSASPGESNSRSRGSTPPTVLPDFHNIPPPLQRHGDFIPPPPPHMAQYPPPPMHRGYKGVPPARIGNHSAGTNGSRHLNDSDPRRQHPNEDV